MRFLLALALLALASAPVLGQPTASDPVANLTQALSLTDQQVDIVVDLLDERDPGALWTLVAELAPTLSDTQKATLLAPPQGGQGRSGGSGRGSMGQGRGGQGRAGGQSAPDAATIAVTRAARNVALGLTEDQATRLDEAEAAQRAQGGGFREPVTPEMAEFLSEAQQEMIRLHRGIARAMRGARPSR